MRFRIRRWALPCGGARYLIPVVWIISSCSSLPAPHREISAGGLVLSVLNDHSNNCFLINIKGWMSADGDREKSVLAASSFFFLPSPLGWAGGKVAKSKPGGKKSGWDVLTGPWLWWRDPITPLPRLVTHSSHHSRAYRQEQSGGVWVSDGCCVIPPLPWSCRLIPLTGPPPPSPRGRERERWEGYKVSVSSNFGFKCKNRSQYKPKIWGDIHKVTNRQNMVLDINRLRFSKSACFPLVGMSTYLTFRTPRRRQGRVLCSILQR